MRPGLKDDSEPSYVSNRQQCEPDVVVANLEDYWQNNLV